jgi:hypothetical protein
MAINRSQFSENQELQSCRVSTVEGTNLNGHYFNGPTNNGVRATLTNAGSLAALQIDQVSLDNGDRVLLIAQTDLAQNGIYDVIEKGSAAVAWILQRSNDFQTIEQIKPGYHLTIEDGFTNAGSIYTVIRPVVSAVGIGSILFRSADQEAQPVNSVLARTISVPGGSASFTVGLTGSLVSSVAVANFDASTNPVTIQKVTPGVDDVAILCDGDPGASFLNIILYKASQ